MVHISIDAMSEWIGFVKNLKSKELLFPLKLAIHGICWQKS